MRRALSRLLAVLTIICFAGLFSATAGGEQKEKEFWCKKAIQHKKKMGKAQDEIKEAEKKLAELEESNLPDAKKKKAVKKTQKDLSDAKKQLKYAERDLSELEDAAHRKGIPPGWLRCQFSW